MRGVVSCLAFGAEFPDEGTVSAVDRSTGIAMVSGSMPTFTVNGLQPGMTMCFCCFRGRRCMPSVPVYCWQANLMMSGLMGASKLNPGGYVPLNANNDNGSVVTNGVPATRDFDVSPNPNEHDLGGVGVVFAVLHFRRKRVPPSARSSRSSPPG